MKWFFDPEKRFKNALRDVELAAFKARCEAAEMLVEAERMKEDMDVKAQRRLEDSARWAQYERERLQIIEKHRVESQLIHTGESHGQETCLSGQAGA